MFFVVTCCISFLFFLANSANAGTGEWFSNEQARLRVVTASATEAGIEYELADGWKIYWRNPGDSGAPTQLDIKKKENLKELTIDWPVPERLVEQFSEDFFLQSYVYHDKVVLPLHITPINAAKPVSLAGIIRFSVCKDTCIPYETPFTLQLSPNEKDEEVLKIIKSYQQHVAIKIAMPPQDFMAQIVEAPSGKYRYFLEVNGLPANTQDIIVDGIKDRRFLKPILHEGAFYIPVDLQLAKTAPLGAKVSFVLKGDQPVEFSYNLPASAKKISFALPDSDQKQAAPISSLPFFTLLLYALLGGLILNVMPCVLPVLSLKLLSVMKHGGKSHMAVRRSLFASAAGIICSFLVFAIAALLLKKAGQSVGWGIQFQEPEFIIFLIIVMVVFALNLFGTFEIRLPSAINDRTARYSMQQDESKLTGSFLTGILATLLATPCTAPFLGVAVSFALAGGAEEILPIFVVMGIGMALPYIVIGLFPRTLKFLPKPGNWMVTFKKTLGVLLLLTAMWLFWVLWSQIGMWPTVVLFFLMALLKFFIEADQGILSEMGYKTAMVIVVIALAFTAPIYRHHQENERDTYVNSLWQPFDAAKIPALVAEGKTVFVDITAKWCTTCQVNKFFVLDREPMLNQLKRGDVVAMRGDMTNPNPEISAYLQSMKASGIPFNAVYGPAFPEGKMLPTLLSYNEVYQMLVESKKTKNTAP